MLIKIYVLQAGDISAKCCYKQMTNILRKQISVVNDVIMRKRIFLPSRFKITELFNAGILYLFHFTVECAQVDIALAYVAGLDVIISDFYEICHVCPTFTLNRENAGYLPRK